MATIWPSSEYLDVYMDGYRKLLDGVQTGVPAARVTLFLLPRTMKSRTDRFAHSTKCQRHSEFCEAMGSFVRISVSCDFNQAETGLAACGNAEECVLRIAGTGSHSRQTHPIGSMAATLARAWGLSPVVSNLQLDGRTGKRSLRRTRKSADLKAEGGKIAVDAGQTTRCRCPCRWTWDDEVCSEHLRPGREMDRQWLGCERPCRRPRYTLKIDGQTLPSFTARTAAAGVNLALYATGRWRVRQRVWMDRAEETRLDEAAFFSRSRTQRLQRRRCDQSFGSQGCCSGPRSSAARPSPSPIVFELSVQ